MSHIFISYSRKDLEVARPIVDALTKDNLDVWIDWEDIPRGEEFEREIQQGIEGSDVFLFLVSPDSAQSDWCNKEIAHAVKNGKRILPIVVRDTDPKSNHPEISKRNWIFCREGQDDFNKGIEETSKTIHTDYEWLKYHTELQVKAVKWEQKKDNSRLLRGKELREAWLRLNDFDGKDDPVVTALQNNYVQASQSFQARQRRILSLIAAGAIGIVFILGVYGLYQKSIAAERAKEIATEVVVRQTAESLAINEGSLRRSQQLGVSSLEQLNSRPDLALLLGVEAYRSGDTYQARKALAEALAFTQCVGRYYYLNNTRVTDVALSANGDRLFAGNRLGDLYVWNLGNGSSETVAGNGYSSQVALNFDDKLFAVSNSGDGTVTILDTGTLEKINEIHTGFDSIFDLEFGNQSNILAIAGNSPPYTEVWNVDNFSRVDHAFESKDGVNHQNFVYEVAFSNDDTHLATAGGHAADQLLIIWDLTSDQNEATYISPPDDVSHPIAFDALGLDFSYGNYQQIFLTGDYYGAQIDSIDTPSNVRSLLFKPSGTYLISGHEDGLIRWWNLSNPDENQNTRLADEYTAHGDAPVLSLSILDDASLMASGDSSGMVVLWSPYNCHPEYSFDPMEEDTAETVSLPEAASFAINRNAERIALAEPGSKDIRLLRLADSMHLETLQAESDRIGLMAFSNSGDHLAVGELESTQFFYADTIRVWDLSSPTRQNEAVDISELPGVTAMAFDSNETTLALGTMDGQIFFYDLANNRFVYEPLTQSQEIALISYSPDGRLLASVDREGKVIFWDVSVTQPIIEDSFSLGVNPFSTMQFSEDSTRLSVTHVDYGNPESLFANEWELEWTTSPELWAEILCSRVGRNLKISEWEKYLPNEPYRLTCPQWSAGQ